MSTHDGDPARRDDHESSGGACSIPIGVTSDGEIVRMHLPMPTLWITDESAQIGAGKSNLMDYLKAFRRGAS